MVSWHKCMHFLNKNYEKENKKINFAFNKIKTCIAQWKGEKIAPAASLVQTLSSHVNMSIENIHVQHFGKYVYIVHIFIYTYTYYICILYICLDL